MKVVSIFSGIDALGLGFEKYFDVVLAVEKEKKACETLIYNKEKYHPKLEVINDHIENISNKFIEKYKGVDGIIGGPPCQPFSNARGKFDPENEKIRYVYDYIKWVEIINPNFFLFENTNSLLDKDKSMFFYDIRDKLANLGYDLSYEILNAHDYGNAQNRRRVIMIGFKKELNVKYKFTKPNVEKKYLRDILDNPGEFSECASYTVKQEKLMPYIPEGGYWRDLPNEELIKFALGKSYENRKGGMTGLCRKLHRDNPCPTITTSATQNTTLLSHPYEHRPLSVSECKRGQGIPDDYVIIGSTSAKYKYIGNGVPVEMATYLAKSIYEVMEQL